MRLTLLITRILFFVLLTYAMVVMSKKAPQVLNRLSHYFKDNRSCTPQKDPRYGGALVWGTINSPTIINPVLTSHSVSDALLDLIFDSLVRIDQHGFILPGLAKSWDISDDGLTYTFHLHPHVYFHDGFEFTLKMSNLHLNL
jgi:ABC-type transport system substrate-binding protein